MIKTDKLSSNLKIGTIFVIKNTENENISVILDYYQSENVFLVLQQNKKMAYLRADVPYFFEERVYIIL